MQTLLPDKSTATTESNSIAGGQSNQQSSYQVYNIYPYRYPVYRLPVSTRPPNVPHHYKIESNPYYKPGNFYNPDIVHHEIQNGIHKITSQYETYEFQYHVQEKPTMLSFLRQ